MSDDLQAGAATSGERSPREPASAAKARQLPVIMDDTLAARLSVLGRTEDVVVSPDGRRVAIACFGASRIALVEFTVERDHERDRPSAVLLTSAVMVDCLGLSLPHGLAFIDDRHVVVADRAGELVLVDIPPVGCDAPCVTVEKRVIANATSAVPVVTPSSVTAIDAGGGIAEVVVCDHDANKVSRLVVDTFERCDVLDAGLLLHKRLDIPDSVTMSPSGEWLAVSNHWTNEVFLYRYDARLGPDDEPVGVLEGPNFPHCLRFSADSRRLAVADSGLPYVHTYAAERGDWSGRRQPTRSVRVMNDDEYLAGKFNYQEGGPKGLEIIDDDRVVVVTSEHQSLAFFDTAELGWPRPTPPMDERATRTSVAGRIVRKARAETSAVRADLVRLGEHSDWQTEMVAQHERARTELSRQLGLVQAEAADSRVAGEELRADVAQLKAEVERLQAETSAQLEENARLRAQVEQLETSTSWRLTGPMRAIADRVKQR